MRTETTIGQLSRNCPDFTLGSNDLPGAVVGGEADRHADVQFVHVIARTLALPHGLAPRSMSTVHLNSPRAASDHGTRRGEASSSRNVEMSKWRVQHLENEFDDENQSAEQEEPNKGDKCTDEDKKVPE
jgi:penicillin V acylase-like amidase (Ntn superfamily)